MHRTTFDMLPVFSRLSIRRSEHKRVVVLCIRDAVGIDIALFLI